ncbi:DUF1674 domain-containing protein [Spiribacter sp. 2438]|uniref:DUF1674 domain-containing protein n=1 Tax=Spiribacter sp. 2438 TaxID=2666185 RepID=UPI0012B14F74|nr:DUF1674 domain-containing protein [Spiribacter sp. 2438]QGM21927.1 DUF1674 domain-containing protein [Spiribacter sp. 2438]
MNDERNPDRQPDSTDHQPVEGSDAPESTSVDWQKPETWPAETGGQRGPEPTRYGDWESNGRCTDF